MSGTDAAPFATAAHDVSHADTDATIAQSRDFVLPLLTEEVVVSRRVVPQAVVRVETITRERPHQVDEALASERVEIERVKIGRIVSEYPATREEGGVTIMPVVEEIVVLERRLMLKEEVHIRRVRTTEQFLETVVVRDQEAVITRTALNDHADHDLASSSITRDQRQNQLETTPNKDNLR